MGFLGVVLFLDWYLVPWFLLLPLDLTRRADFECMLLMI